MEVFQQSSYRFCFFNELGFFFIAWIFLFHQQELILGTNLIFLCTDPWNTELCKLGNYASHWNNDSKIHENIQAFPSSLVLSPCLLPGLRLCHRSCRLGYRPEARGSVEGDSIHCSSLHWHRPLLCSHSTGLIHF